MIKLENSSACRSFDSPIPARFLWGLLLIIVSGTGCRSLRSDFYPLGIYSVATTNNLAIVKNAGFNLVAGSANLPYLNAAHALGLKVLASPDTSAGPKFDSLAARRAVAKFDQHPALWAWYLVDEPDLNIIPPEQVIAANRFFKAAGARKPTALVLYNGSAAPHYGNIADITMIDRYPIPWLPLANFGQHVRMTRLALGQKKPLIAVIQAFDWSYYPELLGGEKNLRPPTYEELRSMTYCALAQRANGIFYFAFEPDRWKILEHPETWSALQQVVADVNRRLPLFQAGHLWWAPRHNYRDWASRFNAALESSITPALLRVKRGNPTVPAGDYVLAVNNTDKTHQYSFELPQPRSGSISVLGESRTVVIENNRVEDTFSPYAVHVYGPFAGP